MKIAWRQVRIPVELAERLEAEADSRAPLHQVISRALVEMESRERQSMTRDSASGHHPHPQRGATNVTKSMGNPEGFPWHLVQSEGFISRRVTITPEDAAKILAERNRTNRKISKSHVAKLSKELSSGRWIFNGSPIKFNWLGELHDGQHRLEACVESGVSIEVVVQFGIDPDSMDREDRVKPRTTIDDLHMRGEKNATNLSAAARMIYLEEIGELENMRWNRDAGTGEIAGVVDRNPGIRDSLEFVIGRHSLRFAPARFSTYLHYRFSQIDSVRAGKFFETLASGAGLAENDPILQLRNRLIANAVSTQLKLKLKPVVILALMIKAWNFHIEGNTTGRLIWLTDRENPEPFPKISAGKPRRMSA